MWTLWRNRSKSIRPNCYRWNINRRLCITGGELPAMVLIDTISRYVDGVINKESIKEESFTNNLLEYPQYTRPEVFLNKKVPEVLLSGNHKK